MIGLWILPLAASGAFAFACPPAIEITETGVTASAGWAVRDAHVMAPLHGVITYDGDPDHGTAIAPLVEATDNGFVTRHALVASPAAPAGIRCLYAGTRVSVTRTVTAPLSCLYVEHRRPVPDASFQCRASGTSNVQ